MNPHSHFAISDVPRNARSKTVILSLCPLVNNANSICTNLFWYENNNCLYQSSRSGRKVRLKEGLVNVRAAKFALTIETIERHKRFGSIFVTMRTRPSFYKSSYIQVEVRCSVSLVVPRIHNSVFFCLAASLRHRYVAQSHTPWLLPHKIPRLNNAAAHPCSAVSFGTAALIALSHA